jgi:hypothetical protein
MTTQVVRDFFENTLKAWAAAQSPAIPISYENVAFTKPTSGSFLECFLLPAATLNPSVRGNRKREVGIFQVNIWTKQGVGSKAGMTIAQAIVDLFPIVPKGTVSIEQHPSIEKSLQDTSGWFITPITCMYRYES